jgi:hypothetical protein
VCLCRPKSFFFGVPMVALINIIVEGNFRLHYSTNKIKKWLKYSVKCRINWNKMKTGKNVSLQRIFEMWKLLYDIIATEENKKLFGLHKHTFTQSHTYTHIHCYTYFKLPWWFIFFFLLAISLESFSYWVKGSLGEAYVHTPTRQTRYALTWLSLIYFWKKSVR